MEEDKRAGHHSRVLSSPKRAGNVRNGHQEVIVEVQQVVHE